jgi:hypothetical protein
MKYSVLLLLPYEHQLTDIYHPIIITKNLNLKLHIFFAKIKNLLTS